MSVCFDILSSL